jgi:phage shock protein E
MSPPSQAIGDHTSDGSKRVHIMRRRAIAIILLLWIAFPVLAESEAPNEAPSIAAAELSARRASGAGPVVIDVRTAEEYATGHIPGALNIPFDQVAERISEVDAPDGVALYCMVGPRARKGESALLSAGYTSVFHLEGGLAAWKAAGLPLEPAE